MCGIYCIENLIDGKKYIGQSIDIEKRIKYHKRLLNSKTFMHPNAHLQNAWNKYGEDNFIFYILEKCNEDDLDNKEKYWSEFYNVYDANYGYALKTAGQGPGFRLISEETRQKMSEANRGANNYWYGKQIPEEIKQKMRDNHYDCAGTNNPRCRQVLQYDLDGNLLKEFNYIREASKITGVEEKHIQNCCGLRILTAGGFIWRYKSDPLIGFNSQDYFRSPRCRAIIQYNLNGMFIGEYKSILEAAEGAKINYNSIRGACRKTSKTAGGFIWRYADDPLSDAEVEWLSDHPITVHEKRTWVDQYSTNGKFIATWDSLAQAGRELHISAPHISECINGNRKTAGGFVWKRHTTLYTSEDNSTLIQVINSLYQKQKKKEQNSEANRKS